ncbi:MAG TPA: tetratricopeptide repeat protein [Candidatus Sulfotelmatobacter sp.]|nr:tetratricopeptide repeat protein [Candidatus Sulfotelmatobacter sp.]
MRLLDNARKKPALLGTLLVLVTLTLYLPVLHHDFLRLWDDDAYVTDNVHVRTGLNATNVAWAFTSFEQSNWHPVTWLSHMLDCQLFGLNPGPPHYENVLLHALNVLLLFWILQTATGAVWRSFMVALLFSIHPLNVETVAWIAQRKSLLSALFSLLTLAAYGWYVRGGGLKAYSAAVLAFALALMSKPMAVSLPLLLLLFDYWPLKRFEDLPLARRWSRLAFEKAPLFAMSVAGSVLTEKAQSSGGSVMGLSLLPVPTRIENALISYTSYVGKILWPVRLSTYYPLRFSPALGDVVASAAILILLTAVALYFQHFRYLTVGWLLFVITLVPVIGIVQVGFQGMADRYTYIPAIGIFIAIVWGLSDLVENVPAAPLSLAFGTLCIATALSVATVRYLGCWRNNVTLFAQARAAWGQPDMWLEQLYGNALFSAGRTDEALQHYQASCAIQSRTEYCHYNIAHILAGRGQLVDAVREYQLALRYTRNREMALLCLTECAQAWTQLDQYAAAEELITQALSIDPQNAAALRIQREIVEARKGGN